MPLPRRKAKSPYKPSARKIEADAAAKEHSRAGKEARGKGPLPKADKAVKGRAGGKAAAKAVKPVKKIVKKEAGGKGAVAQKGGAGGTKGMKGAGGGGKAGGAGKGGKGAGLKKEESEEDEDEDEDKDEEGSEEEGSEEEEESEEEEAPVTRGARTNSKDVKGGPAKTVGALHPNPGCFDSAAVLHLCAPVPMMRLPKLSRWHG